MAEHCQRGLSWEVLSHKTAVQEPDAFELIQAVLNAKNDTAMMEHEMEHLNGLATVIQDTGQGMADQFNWRLVRDKLMNTGNTVVAESPEFLCLSQSVGRHTSGAKIGLGYNHWTEMKTWHETMINPKTRRVRLATIAQLAHVPKHFPRLRNALFRTAYSANFPTTEQTKNGQVFFKTVSSLSHLADPELRPALLIAEEILELWHIKYTQEGAFKHLQTKDLNRLVGSGGAEARVLWTNAF